MMDKNREVFEKFITDEAIKRNYQFMDNLFSKFGDDYSVTWVDMAWMGWTASRQAIEVELPTEMTRDNDYASGFNQCLSECNDALTSLGIRVKGNEE